MFVRHGRMAFETHRGVTLLPVSLLYVSLLHDNPSCVPAIFDDVA